MSLPAVEKKLATETLARYCESRVPAHARDQVRMGYRFRGNSATVYEERAPRTGGGVWVDIVVAQFRYDDKTKLWTLYCADRNSNWHLYDEVEPAKSIQTLVDEVEDDPTGIFWG